MNHPSNPVYSDTPTYYTPKGYGSYEYRTDVLSAEDWLGHTFAVGDTVMYCIGDGGRGQQMAVGTVKQIRSRVYAIGRWDYGDPVDYKNKKFVKTGEETLVEVQVFTSKTSKSNYKRTMPAWVTPENITAIPEGFVE